MKTPVLALAALSLASIGAAQVTPVGGGYDIKVKYTPGKTYNYALNTAIKMSNAPQGAPGSQNVAMSLSQQVVSVKNGIATLKVTGKGGPAGNAPPQTVQVNNRGKIVGGSTSSSGFNFLSGFPARPVKVGERWTAKTAMPMGGMGAGQADVAYTFRGLSNVSGKRVARIDFTLKMAGPAAMTGNGTAYLDAADGQLVNSSLKGLVKVNTAAMGGGRPGAKPLTVNLNVVMKRAG